MYRNPAVAFVDNTSADNPSLIMALILSPWIDLKAVFVTGRAAHSDPNAPTEERDDDYSDFIHELNTLRMVEFVRSLGSNVKVFKGQEVRDTALRTVIKHAWHVNEEIYNLWDAWSFNYDGTFEDGLRFLGEYEGPNMLVFGGGPLTEIAFILNNRQDIATKFGPMFIQAGDFAEDESTNLLGGKGNSFNGACDAKALHDVVVGYDGDIFVLPSNITKQPEIGFAHPDEIAELGVYDRLVKLYGVHYEHTAKRRGTSLFIHDLGLAMLAEQVLGYRSYPYQCVPVNVVEVPYGAPAEGEPERRGTIVIEPTTASNRYVVVWQNTERYRQRVRHHLTVRKPSISR